MHYRPELDGLRALAVVAVVLFHADPAGPVSGGFIGVDLFFVLSGFLITSILASEWQSTGTIRLANFYWRRFLRLMPPLLLLLVAYLGIAPLIWPTHDHALDALLTALYLSDYSFELLELPRYLAHSWSLAVEEHYYLIWPLLLPLLLRSKHPLVWLALAWTLISIWRTSHLDGAAHFRFDTRASGLILGSGLYFAALRGSDLWAWSGLAAFAAVTTIASLGSAVLAIPAAEMAAAALVVGSPTLPFLRHRSLVWLGKLSYGIYLWHYPIDHALGNNFGFLRTAAITLPLSIALAAASWFTVEAWARRLRNTSAIPLRSTRPVAS